MAKRVPLELEDGSGGLNLRDPRTALKPNQFSRLENYVTDEGAYLKKRLGQTLIQYTPPDPKPFVSDANTVGLWHLDDAAAPWTDSGPNSYDLNPIFAGPVSGPGLFPVGAGKGAVFSPTTPTTDAGPIFRTVSSTLDGQGQLTIQGWLNINAAFSGAPVQVNRFGQSFATTQSGAVLWATCAFADDQINPGALVNGLQLFRDWDATHSRDLGNPYVTFTLRTKGKPGTVTVIKSGALPFANMVHLRVTYNQATGLVQLFINGSPEATAAPVGGGVIDDTLAKTIAMGAGFNQSYVPTFPQIDSGDILDFAIDNDTLYLVGDFTSVGGVPRNNAAAINISTGEVLPWNPNPDGEVGIILLAGNLIYMGGTFQHVNWSTFRNAICSVDKINGVATSWDPNLDNGVASDVTAILVSGNTVYIGGSFTHVNGLTARVCACAVDATTAIATAFDPHFNQQVNAFVLIGSTLYCGGEFTRVNNGTVTRNYAAAVDTGTSAATAWNPNLDFFVNALTLSGATIFIGGNFGSANGGTVRINACQVDLVNGTLTAWNALIAGASSIVSRIKISNGVVYLAGGFSSIGGQTRNGAGAVSLDTAALNGWSPVLPANALVSALSIDRGIIFFGGFFSSVDGVVTRGFGSWRTPLYNVGNFTLDEWEVSNIEVSGFPFRNPLGRGMVLERSDGTKQLVVGTDAGLYFTVGDGNWTLITATDPLDGSPISATAYWDGVQMGDRLYMCNGVNSPLTWNGSTFRPTGNPIHPLTVSLSAGGATNTNGSHDYVYTRKYGNVETGPSPVATVVVAGNKDVNIQGIETALEDCTSLVIYKTKANTPGTYYRLREITNDITQPALTMAGAFGNNGNPLTDTGADGVPDGSTSSDLNDIAFYSLMLASVQGSQFQNGCFYLTEHDRLFLIPNASYSLYWSEVGNPDVMTALSFIKSSDEKGPLIGMSSWYGEIILSKNGKATSILRGTDPSNWVFTENIHPDIGALDHWSFVRRYPLAVTMTATYQVSSYTLMFLAYDGIYSFNGTRPEKVSDVLNPLFVQLQTQAKLSWVSQGQALFQVAAQNGGSVAQNIQASNYSTDGLREAPGQIRIVNQLDYIGLWGEQAALVPGNVIAMCKGPAEGEFYFSTDASQALYRTADNFLTAQTIASPLVAPDNFIELVYAPGIGVGGSDSIWLFTAGTGAGGAVYKLDDPIGAFGIGPNFTVASAGSFYWQADTDWWVRGSLVNTNLYQSGFVNGRNAGLNSNLDHAQNVRGLHLDGTPAIGLGGIGLWQGAASISANNPNQVTNTTDAIGYTAAQYVGFFGQSNTTNFLVNFTKRESAFWQGGSFRPQAFWDAQNQQLIFCASEAADQYGNYLSHVFKLTTGGALTSLISGHCFYSIASDGANCWFVDQKGDNINFNGFIPVLKTFALSNPAVITTQGALTANYLPLRLVYNEANGTLYCGGKVYPNTDDSLNYQGFLASLSTAGVFTVLKTYASNGAYPVELAYQQGSPNAVLAALASISAPDTQAIDSIDASGSVTALSSTPFQGATGIASNLLAVPQSGAAGNFLWADRIYWQGRAASQQPLVQLGVAGAWVVQGSFVSSIFNFGTFSAFGNLSVASGGNVAFFMRDAAAAGGLPASELSVAPNQQINGFAPVQPLGQWRALLTWDYLVSHVSPQVTSVEITYFLGTAQGPRPVAEHWNGRTYFALANPGDSQNSFVVVYDKKNAWTIYTGWALKGMQKFRNQLTAIQAYQLVQLESGLTDAGEPIVGVARTGSIEDGSLIAIEDVQGNFGTFSNPNFPFSNAYVTVTPLAAEVPQNDAWVFSVPALANAVLNLLGTPLQVRPISWAKSFSLEIGTSQAAAFPAFAEQQEVIQKLSLKMLSVPVGREYAGV